MMVSEDVEARNGTPHVPAQFDRQKYINLETVRRSGQAVQTTVWFAEEGGLLYVAAPAHTGKVKRIRHTSQVRVVPCDNRSTSTGTWVDAEARIIDGEQAERAERLLRRKYGWQKRLVDLFGRFKKWRSAIIEINLDSIDTAFSAR